MLWLRLFHIGIIIGLLVTPFVTQSCRILQLYLAFVFAMYMHWAINDDSCVLTQIEMILRGTPEKKESFIYMILHPWFTPPSNGCIHVCEIVLLGILSLVAAHKWVRIYFSKKRGSSIHGSKK